MDYRALAELVMFSLMGLTMLTVAVGFSVRMFLAPTIKELFGRRDGSNEEQKLLAARVDAFEDRLESIENNLERIADAVEFDRQLEAPKGD